MKKYRGKISYVGEIAAKYEQDRREETIWQKEEEWVKNYIRSLPKNSSILDLPVGTGRFFQLYSEKQFNIIGIDVSKDMIAEAKLKRKSLSNNLSDTKLFVGDAEKLKMKDNSVDYIICFRLFHLTPFKIIIKILAEFYRVVNHEVIIEIFNSSLHNNVESDVVKKQGVFERWKSALYSRIEDYTNTLTTSQRKTPWHHISNFRYNQQYLEIEFERVGFCIKKIEVINDKQNPATIYTLHK